MKFAQNIKYKEVKCSICDTKREVYIGDEWRKYKSFYCHNCKRVVKEK